MPVFQRYSKSHRRLRWERFWPRTLIIVLAVVELLLTGAVLCLEFWSMIIHLKYSFFFMGFMASFVFIVTWILTFIVGCCCRKSPACATYTAILHLLSIAASSILIFYDVSFLRNPYTCLWPKNLCQEGLTNRHLFGLALNTGEDIHWLKWTSLKIQIGCAAAVIGVCTAYVMIYIYTGVRVHAKNAVADPHTINELGRVQSPPPPQWPEPPRELPPASEF